MNKKGTYNRIMKEVSKVVKSEISKLSKPILEGVSFDDETNTFSFNFTQDNETDIINLKEFGNQINAFGRCFYYGYEFTPDVSSEIRGKFIKYVKFPETDVYNDDILQFIKNAVDYLDSEISLPSYNVIVYQQSLSEINRKMLSYLSRITSVKYVEFELIKDLPCNIEFDRERFEIEVLDSYAANGRPRYTQQQKNEVLGKIQAMMDDIHNKDYFSIAQDVKKSKYRPYIKNYYKFKDEASKKTFELLQNNNIILLDDIVTSGTTIFHLLKTMRTINDSNKITVFSLIGKNKIQI